MERTPEVILSEIKDALKGIALKVEELENILHSGPSEFADIPDGFGLDPLDFDIELAEDTAHEPEYIMDPEVIPEALPETAPAPEEETAPAEETSPERAAEVAPAAEQEHAAGKPSGKSAGKSADKTRAWMVDVPCAPVINILSAISLNDRILFINTLFDKDPVLFQDTIRLFNSCSSLNQVLEHIAENFPKWNLNSQTVYRFMMAVRRKIQ